MNFSELSGAPLSAEPPDIALEARREVESLRAGFVNTLVRDVRLPLASLLGTLDLFESKMAAREPFDGEDRRLLSAAIEHGARMRSLIDDLMELAQQDAAPLVLSVERADASGLIAEAVESLRPEAALRGVEIGADANDHPPVLAVDVRQTARALRHLICAALGATHSGGRVTVEARGLVGTRRGDAGRGLVLINVSDTGDGIPPEELPFLFDSFWQPSDPRRRSDAGRRVGLAIARRVAAAHGGSVSVRSEVGAGTVYSLVLPAHSEAGLDAGTARPRVLVVDDAPDLLALVGKLVERMGYDALLAPDASRALELLSAEPVDLLLTDWAMPGMSGGELVERVRSDERLSRLPVVVLTGHDMERRHASEAGCDQFLVKPVARDELHAVISRLLDGAAARA